MHQDHFFSTFLKSFNPIEYKNLANYPFGKALAYFFSLLFVGFVLVVLLSIPKFVSYERSLNEGISKFQELNLTLGIKMSSPLLLSEKNPLVIIDTTGNYTNLSESNLLVTDTKVMKKNWLCFVNDKMCTILGKGEAEITDIKSYENLLVFKDQISSFMKLILILVLPIILFVLFLVYMIKYFTIVVFFTLIGFVIALLSKHQISFKEIFKVSLFASTILVMLDVISFTMVNLSLLSISLYLLIFVIGLITAGIKEVKKPF